MHDAGEQAYIRGQYENEPGKGHLVEQLAGERENALTRGDDAGVIRVEDQMAVLGYQTPEQRADAAAARKDDAARRSREKQRIRENRGEAAARDDEAGGPVEQHAGVVDEKGNPATGKPAAKQESGDEEPKKQPPAGRTSRQGSQAKG